MARDPRAAAARAVAAVLAGRSLDAVLNPASAAVVARDRGFVAELAYGTLRIAPRLQALLALLLERPLRDRDRDLEALLLVGLYQLADTRVPDHAAVAATVGAAGALGKGWARGLANAVLRRYRREQATLEAALPAAAKAAHPPWLYRALQQEWREHAPGILAAGNGRPPMTLRVNIRRRRRADYLSALAAAGIEARAGTLAPEAVYIADPRPVDELPGFTGGEVSVQDEAAQLAAGLLAPGPGARVLDTCAAPGGKACHLLEYAACELTAVDVDGQRLRRVEDNLARLGLAARIACGDAAAAATLAGDAPWDRVLVDAPCSGSGVLRRHPDIKVLRHADDPPRLAARQRAILDTCWARLKPGGRLLYVTCSLLASENDGVVGPFLATHRDAGECTPAQPGALRLRHGIQVLPAAAGPDGLYFALLEKAA